MVRTEGAQARAGRTQTGTEGWGPTVAPGYWRRGKCVRCRLAWRKGVSQPRPQLPSRSWVREGEGNETGFMRGCKVIHEESLAAARWGIALSREGGALAGPSRGGWASGPHAATELCQLGTQLCLTPELSVLMALICRQSSTVWLLLLASTLSSGPRPPGSVLASLSPFSLSSGARTCTSLRCFLVTWASGPWTVFTCLRSELGSVYLLVQPGILQM